MSLSPFSLLSCKEAYSSLEFCLVSSSRSGLKITLVPESLYLTDKSSWTSSGDPRMTFIGLGCASFSGFGPSLKTFLTVTAETEPFRIVLTIPEIEVISLSYFADGSDAFDSGTQNIMMQLSRGVWWTAGLLWTLPGTWKVLPSGVTVSRLTVSA